MDNIDVLRQMYATLCGGIGDALTQLEHANIWRAKAILQTALHRAEELYIAGERAADELNGQRRS